MPNFQFNLRPFDSLIQKRQSNQCFVRQCDQLITGRNLLYARALEIIQNEEYLSAADLDIIRRVKRQNARPPKPPDLMPITTTEDNVTEEILEPNLVPDDSMFNMLRMAAVAIGAAAASALLAFPSLPLTQASGVPPGNTTNFKIPFLFYL